MLQGETKLDKELGILTLQYAGSVLQLHREVGTHDK